MMKLLLSSFFLIGWQLAIIPSALTAVAEIKEPVRIGSYLTPGLIKEDGTGLFNKLNNAIFKEISTTSELIISSLNIAKEQLSPIVQWGAVEGLHQFNELTNTEATNLGIELLSFDDAELKEEILRWFQFHGSQEAIQPTHDIIYEGIPPYVNDEVLNQAFDTLDGLGAIDELINLLRATNRPSFNLAAAYELRFMEQLNQHEDRVAVAENVVQCLQNDDNFDDSDQVWLDEIRAVD